MPAKSVVPLLEHDKPDDPAHVPGLSEAEERRHKAVKADVPLRSPIAFRLPGPLTLETTRAPPVSVEIAFEDWRFVWHPPMDHEDDELGITQYGPMVSYIVADQHEYSEAVRGALQRFLSGVAFLYDQPVEDVDYGAIVGSGESDPFNPHGHRHPRSYVGTWVIEAPAAVEVDSEPLLRRALAYYREGLNAGSPFYGCLAFRNVLDLVFGVVQEMQHEAITAEAAARDAFIDSVAPAFAQRRGLGALTLDRTWSVYLREEVRNALAHVHRAGRREVDPDDFRERQRFLMETPVSQSLARAIIEQEWPNGVRAVARKG